MLIFPPLFMMHLRSLVLFLLCLPGGARRSIRIGDSHHDAHQQHSTLANGLNVTGKARGALIPGVYSTSVVRGVCPQPADFREGSHPTVRQAGDLESHRAAPWFRFGPRRTKVTLQIDGGPEALSDRIENIEANIRELAERGCDEQLLAPLKRELAEMKIAYLEDELNDLKQSQKGDRNSAATAPRKQVDDKEKKLSLRNLDDCLQKVIFDDAAGSRDLQKFRAAIDLASSVGMARADILKAREVLQSGEEQLALRIAKKAAADKAAKVGATRAFAEKAAAERRAKRAAAERQATEQAAKAAAERRAKRAAAERQAAERAAKAAAERRAKRAAAEKQAAEQATKQRASAKLRLHEAVDRATVDSRWWSKRRQAEVRQQLIEAIEAAKNAGVPPADISWARQILRSLDENGSAQTEDKASPRGGQTASEQTARRASAGKTAERAAAERTAAERRAAELRAAEEALREAWRLTGKKRVKAIRKLQVRYHPDRPFGDDEDRQLADKISRMANAAQDLARKQRR